MRPVLWLLVLALAGCATTSAPPQKAPESVTIGALLPLTGSLASYGDSSRAALAEAVAVINARGGPRLTLLTEDSRTDPSIARAMLERLAGRGVSLVVGPYASSEVQAVRDVTATRGVVIISPLSTARTLATPNDNILRFTPDDEHEAAAVAALAIADGVRVMVTATRDDEGNQGLQSAFRRAFERRGGRVVPGVTYGANERDFTTSARSLLRNVVQARQNNPNTRIGIYLTAFDEVVPFFNQVATAARNNPGALTGIHWYGSDAVAQSKELVANSAAANFALHAGYPNPILGLDERTRATWGPVYDRIAARLGRTPDAFALAAYDAVMVGYDALLKADRAGGAEALRKEVVSIANRHEGLTGRTRLNAAGDRASGNYDFWAVCRVGNTLAWGKAAVFSGGEARRVSGCDQHPR